MSAAFNTLHAARRLEAAGLDRNHAEAVIDEIRNSHDELATSAQVQGLDDKVERLDEKANALNAKVERLDEKANALNGKVERLDEKVDGLNGKVEALDKKIDSVFGTLRWMVSVYFAMTIAILATLLAHAL